MVWLDAGPYFLQLEHTPNFDVAFASISCIPFGVCTSEIPPKPFPWPPTWDLALSADGGSSMVGLKTKNAPQSIGGKSIAIADRAASGAGDG